MQEEIERQTVALVFKASKFTVESLSHAMKKALEKGLTHTPHISEPSGKMTLSDLIGKGEKAEKIEISKDSLKTFQKTADKYNVDYAIHKEPDGDKYKYYVFFQAKDTAAIESAFKEYAAENEKRKESLQRKLDKKKEIVRKRKEKEQSKEKNRNKEQSR